MRWPTVVLAVLVSGCSFQVPRERSARELCRVYAAELERKMEECGDPPDAREVFNGRNLARCDRVVLVNPLAEPVERCIEEIRRSDCATRNDAKWCPAFVER